MSFAAFNAGVPITVTADAIFPAVLGLYGLLPERWSPHRSRRKIKKHWKQTAGLIEIEPAKPACFQVGTGLRVRFVMHPTIYAELQREITRRASKRIDEEIEAVMRGGFRL